MECLQGRPADVRGTPQCCHCGFRIDGDFTAVLQPGFFTPGVVDVSLAQTARVPLFANSLQFKLHPFSTNLTVSLGGQNLSLVPLEGTVGYNLYGADVSAFAGQMAELRFTAATAPLRSIFLDAITFSSSPVPEPSTWALLTLGSTILWCAARRSRK